MPVNRQDIKAEVGPGNFGSRGTPLGFTPFRKGPDLGRLIGSLGLAYKTAKGNKQKELEEDTQAAELEVRQAMLEHRTDKAKLDEAITGIREKYKDPGVLADAFGLGNPALRAVEGIVANDQRVTETKQALANLHNDMKGESPEAIAQASNKLLQDQFNSMQDFRPEAKLKFLEQMNKYTIGMYEKSKEEYRIAQEETTKKKVGATGFTKSVSGIESWTGKTVEQSTQSSKDFEEYNQNFDKNKDKIMGQLFADTRDIYERVLAVSGDTKEAAAYAFQHLATVAENTNRPELLDLATAELSRNGDGRNINGLFGREVFELKQKLQKRHASIKASLTQLDTQKLEANNQAWIDDINAGLLTEATRIENTRGPEKAKLNEEFQHKVMKGMQQLMRDRDNGKFDGNQKLYHQALFMYKSQMARVVKENGSVYHTNLFNAKLERNQLTHQDVITLLPKLQGKDRSRAVILLDRFEEVNKSKDQFFKDNEALEWQARSKGKFEVFKNDYDAFMKKFSTAIDTRPPGTEFLIEDFTKEYNQALIEAQREFINSEDFGKDFNVYAPDETLQKHLEPVMNKYNEKFKTLRDAANQTPDANDASTQLPSEIRKTAEGRAIDKQLQEQGIPDFTSPEERQQEEFDAVASQITERGITDKLGKKFKFKEPVKDITTIYNAHKAGIQVPQTVMAHAVTAELQENQEALIDEDGYLGRPSQVLGLLFSRMGFDLSRPQNVEQVAHIIGTGLEDYAIRINREPTHSDRSLFTETQGGDQLSAAIKNTSWFSEKSVRQFVERFYFPEYGNEVLVAEEGPNLRKRLVDEEVQKLMELVKQNQVRFKKR